MPYSPSSSSSDSMTYETEEEQHEFDTDIGSYYSDNDTASGTNEMSLSEELDLYRQEEEERRVTRMLQEQDPASLHYLYQETWADYHAEKEQDLIRQVEEEEQAEKKNMAAYLQEEQSDEEAMAKAYEDQSDTEEDDTEEDED